MNTTAVKIIVGVVVAIAVTALCATAIVFVPASFPGRYSGPPVEFRIEQGDSINSISNELYNRGLVKSRLFFKLYAALAGQDENLKAGLYKLDSNMSIRDLVRIFAGGLSENEDINITIPEGSNINDIDLIFAKSALTKKGDFLKAAIISREGYLFPDTYKFLPGTTIDEILAKLGNNFNARTGKFLSGLSPEEAKRIIIVASLLEKEVQTPVDMRLVAGIMEKRLSLGMRLEIDATSAYGECYKSFIGGINCEVSEANILKAIVNTSPYNTYRISGLPAGPISNPGLAAIEAALNPTPSDYLFYLTDKEGKVYYGKNLSEHNRNRANYLNK